MFHPVGDDVDGFSGFVGFVSYAVENLIYLVWGYAHFFSSFFYGHVFEEFYECIFALIESCRHFLLFLRDYINTFTLKSFLVDVCMVFC